MSRLRAIVIAAGLVGVLGAGCVFPARSYPAYEGKAAETAKTAETAAQTGLLAAEQAHAGKMTAAYASVTMADAEGDAGGAQQDFDSIQPPDARSDALHAELDPILTNTVDTLRQLRIAARRGELTRLAVIAAPLREQIAHLQHFQDVHG